EEASRYEGDCWTSAFAGRLCRLRDAKGLHRFAHLLARPGEYIPAADLLMALDRGGVAVSGGSTNGTMAAPAGDAGPLLDGHAKNAYPRRVHELRVLFDDAERSNDAPRAAAGRAGMEVNQDQPAPAVRP